MGQGIIATLLALGDRQEWPEFETAATKLSAEMPKEAKAVGSIKPMNPMIREIYRLIAPGTTATTSPFGNIRYDRDNAKAASISPEDLMAHELTHVGQAKAAGPARYFIDSLAEAIKPWGTRTFEQEATDREMSRLGKRRLTDIHLGNE